MGNQPEVKLGCVANLFSRMMVFKDVGDIELGHSHQFDHLTLLASGSLNVTVEDVTTNFVAPHMIYIRADKMHTLVATQPNTVAYCIHALRDKNDPQTILDPAMIPKGVDASLAGLAAPVCIDVP